MVLNPPQVEAHLRFRALLEDCHFSSLRAPKEAGFGAPCLARVCLGQTQKLLCLPLFPGGQGGLERVSLLGPPESWSTEGAVLFSARKWQYNREWISFFKGRRPRVGLAELPQEDSALSFSWSEWHPIHCGYQHVCVRRWQVRKEANCTAPMPLYFGLSLQPYGVNVATSICP